jgi:hypothetical protein
MGDKVKVSNFMIETFQRDMSFNKLRVSEDIGQALKFTLFKLMELLTNGVEATALREAKNALIQAEGEEDQLDFNHPKVAELMALDSGIELDKIEMLVKDIPKAFTLEDMIRTSWLIEFKDE